MFCYRICQTWNVQDQASQTILNISRTMWQQGLEGPQAPIQLVGPWWQTSKKISKANTTVNTMGIKNSFTDLHRSMLHLLDTQWVTKKMQQQMQLITWDNRQKVMGELTTSNYQRDFGNILLAFQFLRKARRGISWMAREVRDCLCIYRRT